MPINGEAISGLLGAIIGAVITWFTAYSSNKTQREIAKQAEKTQDRNTLDGLILRMIEFAMEYPYLERDGFPSSYPNCLGHQHCKERYETYCCFVFNTLQFMFNHFDGNRQAIESYYHIRETIRLHHVWWKHDRENLEYDEPFRQYIQSIIDELRKRGEIQ